jgi:hypothetical protein
VDRRTLRAGRDARLTQDGELLTIVECAFERLALAIQRVERGELLAEQSRVRFALAVRLVDEAAEVAERDLVTAPQEQQATAQRRPLEEPAACAPSALESGACLVAGPFTPAPTDA